MVSAAFQQIESLLRARRLDSTLTRLGGDLEPDRSCLAATGLPALDAALGGGWRRGHVSEVIGPGSSGRTSVLLATLSEATRRGEVVGLVDASDRFDPVTAAAVGLDLARVLWVRGPDVTPQAPRGTVLEVVLRRAIRAFDLIIRAGGFGVVALDLADIPPQHVRYLPAVTWLRLAHATEGRETVGLLLGDAPISRSARGVSVRLSAAGCWAGSSERSRRLAGLDVQADLVSARLGPGVRA